MNNEGNKSFRKLHQSKIRNIDETSAIVETKEEWKVDWFGIAENKYISIYEETNDQNYIISKENGNWKILSNDYTSSGKYLPPIGIDSTLIKKVEKQTIQEFKKLVLPIIQEGKTMTAMDLLLVKLTQQENRHEVIVLKSQFKDWIAILNNKKITLEKFYNKKGEIDLKLLSIIESL